MVETSHLHTSISACTFSQIEISPKCVVVMLNPKIFYPDFNSKLSGVGRGGWWLRAHWSVLYGHSHTISICYIWSGNLRKVLTLGRGGKKSKISMNIEQ